MSFTAMPDSALALNTSSIAGGEIGRNNSARTRMEFAMRAIFSRCLS
eukprot:CAMPEP_0179616666 /NCGR_PEP_ID=MMETSP0930-20121108/6751_1 /TAXON_ID=548131 ORGANISM="Ostreococcus mediterraneus, Strain clade-D-RCC1621" /NCGR_SAMPLE_ID=MMETSP0930 /ASSEMBLY_ACC=CAM_ASM_000580 /LENGTH=46 /DNA_ID= /DNA_START= /DNA_END= /DNA_ORIENTATION=